MGNLPSINVSKQTSWSCFSDTACPPTYPSEFSAGPVTRQAGSQALGSACRQGHLLSLLQLARLQGLILRSQLIVLLKHKVGPSASGTSRWWETLG